MAQNKLLIDAGFKSNGDSIVNGNLTATGKLNVHYCSRRISYRW